MNKKLVVISCVFFIASLSWSQNHQQKLADVFLEDGPNHTETSGYSFNGFYSNSGSFWQLDWPETYVFDKLIAYNDPSNPDKSYQMRLGKGGQIYSFKSAFGEALPPQYRRSYNEAGSALLDQPISNPVKSHDGNWAPWNDEVWQIVASDQIDELNGTKAAQNIHQAGPYMNNYNTRASDLTKEPFYSPLVHSYFDASNQSYTSVYWGQSEDPSYVYNPTNLLDPFRPSVLIYQRYKNLGDGVIQVDFMVFNYHRTRAIGYWSVPWAGIRNSSLPYAFIANNFNDVTSYETLSIPLPVFNDGVTRNVDQTGGWFAFSNASNGNGPSMAFVTAKESISGGYSDYRWGTALGTDNIRDATIFSKRHIPGTSNKWELVGGEGIRGRYFLVVDSSIDAIVNQIKTRNLVNASSVELFTFTEKDLTNINYNFSANPSGNYSVIESNSSNAYLSVKPKPFLGSYPAYLLSTATESRITANPYYYSLKPYDGSVKSIKLLGFTTTALDLNPATACANTWYLDADGDNFAIATVVSCNSPGSGYTTSVLPITDCDDNNANINPSASDVLDNGIDENCDGEDASSFDIWHEIKKCYQLPITTIQSIYTASVTNPNTSGINSNATVSKMEKNGAGAARIKLNNPITNTSSLNISLQLLATEAGSNGIGSGFFRIQLQTLKTSPATTTLVASLAVSSANTWEFKNIDLSGIVIPQAVIDAGGYEYLYIVSGATAPGASIFYFDKIKSNLTQGISVNVSLTPTFTPVAGICSGGSLSALPTTSNNGIAGTWSPALDNTTTTLYTFTPTAGLCATTATMTIIVDALTTEGSVTTSICAGDAYVWPANGQTYITAQNGITYVSGCNTATLNLTVTPRTTIGSITTSICEGDTYVWPANGESYTTAQSGTTFVSGCNTATLNLTVTPRTTIGSVTTSICEGDTYVWPANGESYTTAQSGTTFVSGCNTATLNLTVTPRTTIGSFTTSICAGDAYVWPANGQTYITAQNGTTFVSGCNTATLNLTVTPKPAAVITNATICSGDTYNWSVNSTNYSTAQTVTITNDICTADQVLNLTVTPAANAGTNGTLSLSASPSDADLFAALTGADARGSWTRPSSGYVGVYTYTVNAISPCTVNATSTVTVSAATLLPAADTTYNLCAGAKISNLIAAATASNGSVGVKVYAAATGGSPIVLSGATDAVIPTSTTPKAYWLTEPANTPSGESARVRVFAVVNVLPATPSALVLTNDNAVLPAISTTAVTAVGVFVGTNAPFKLTATATGAVSYKWTLPTGVVRTNSTGTTTDSDATSTDAFIYVKFTVTGVATPLVIGVQSVNDAGCTSAIKASASLTRLLPAAPSALAMNNGLNTTAITSFAKYMGSPTVLRLSATAAVTATSYLWELPTGVNRMTALEGGSITTDLASTDPFIFVNFAGVTEGNTDTNAIVLTTLTKVLRIGVKSVNGVGSSVTANATAVNPTTTSTAKLLTLTAVAPAAPTALVLNNGTLTTAITVISKFIGQGGTYRLATAVPATTVATSFAWELPSCVTRVTDLSGSTADNTSTSTDPFIFVKFNGTNPAAGSIYFGVKAVNGIGSSVTNNSLASPGTSSTAKLLKLATVVPAAPASLAMNNGVNTTAITVISKMIGQEATVRLVAATSALASSYTWELPSCVTRVTDLGGLTADVTNTSTNPEIFVKFNGTNPAAGSIYFGVKAVNGIGSSVTNNSLASPGTSSTAKLLKLATVVPAAPASLAMNNGVNTTAITVISKMIGQEATARLVAATSALASSYTWELPSCVTRVTDLGGLTADVTNTSTNPEIFVKFNGTNPAAGSIFFGVTAVNGVGSSLTSNSAASPATSSTAKLLKLVTVVPAGPTTLVLNDVNNGPSTTAVAVVSKYIGTSTKLKLTAAVSVLANTYQWILPTGVNRVDELGDVILSPISQEPFIFVNFLNVPHESTTISLVLGVKAVNSVGSSITSNTGANSARTDKLLIVTAGLPVKVAAISGSLTVCDRSQGFTYVITAPLGAKSYIITAPVGSVVSAATGIEGATLNVLTTSDLTFKVVYNATPFTSTTTDKYLQITSVNDFGISTTGFKSAALIKQADCSSLTGTARIAAKSVTEEFKVLAYPNPTLNNFRLSKEIKEAKLYNVSGKKVADYNTNQSQYNIAQLPKGVYLLKAILLNNSIETIRIVKE